MSSFATRSQCIVRHYFPIKQKYFYGMISKNAKCSKPITYQHFKHSFMDLYHFPDIRRLTVEGFRSQILSPCFVYRCALQSNVGPQKPRNLAPSSRHLFSQLLMARRKSMAPQSQFMKITQKINYLKSKRLYLESLFPVNEMIRVFTLTKVFPCFLTTPSSTHFEPFFIIW